ncbi:MAG: response regulator transcription factor, partial [Candidatus Binatia bacterium]
VVLDLLMPGWGGIETLLRMREVDPTVGVVIVTAYGSRGDALKALRLDTFELVAKPFASAEVIAAVGRAAEAAHGRRRRSRPHRRKVSPGMHKLCGAAAVEPRSGGYREFEDRRAMRTRPSSEDGELGLLWAVFDDGIQTYCRELQNGRMSSLDYREVEWWIFHSRGDALTSFGNLCELFAIDPRGIRRALAALRDRPDDEIMGRLVRSA